MEHTIASQGPYENILELEPKFESHDFLRILMNLPFASYLVVDTSGKTNKQQF